MIDFLKNFGKALALFAGLAVLVGAAAVLTVVIAATAGPVALTLGVWIVVSAVLAACITWL